MKVLRCLPAALLLALFGSAVHLAAQNQPQDIATIDPNFKIETSDAGGLRYLPATDPALKVQGLHWFPQDQVFRRLPVNPPAPLPANVDKLAWHTAGAQVRFRTDSRKIELRVKLRPFTPMYHMPLSGQSGFDLYAGPPGAQRFIRAAIPRANELELQRMLVTSSPGQMVDYTLNLPLYAGVESLEIGILPTARIEPPSPPARPGPIVVYSGSTTQGACATRPGNCHTNILSRKLNCEFLNLGFSGSGRIEAEVATTLATIPNPQLFIIGPDSNSTMPELQERFATFMSILRQAHPKIPILILTRHRRATEAWSELQGSNDFSSRTAKVDFLRAAVKNLQEQGDPNLFFHDGADLLGDDFENCSVDGSHPNDIGFYRMAQCIEPLIRQLINLPDNTR